MDTLPCFPAASSPVAAHPALTERWLGVTFKVTAGRRKYSTPWTESSGGESYNGGGGEGEMKWEITKNGEVEEVGGEFKERWMEDMKEMGRHQEGERYLVW